MLAAATAGSFVTNDARFVSIAIIVIVFSIAATGSLITWRGLAPPSGTGSTSVRECEFLTWRWASFWLRPHCGSQHCKGHPHVPFRAPKSRSERRLFLSRNRRSGTPALPSRGTLSSIFSSSIPGREIFEHLSGLCFRTWILLQFHFMEEGDQLTCRLFGVWLIHLG
jgi:hypothetical protein